MNELLGKGSCIVIALLIILGVILVTTLSSLFLGVTGGVIACMVSVASLLYVGAGMYQSGYP